MDEKSPQSEAASWIEVALEALKTDDTGQLVFRRFETERFVPAFRTILWDHLEEIRFFVEASGSTEKARERLNHDPIIDELIGCFLDLNKDLEALLELSSEDIDEFLNYLPLKRPGFCLGAYLKDNYPEIVRDYAADIPPSERFETLEYFDEEEMKAEYLFALSKYDESEKGGSLPNEAEDFREKLLEEYRDKDIEEIGNEEAEYLRRGMMKFADDIFTDKESDDFFWDFASAFIHHFEGTPALDLRRHKTKQETVWFLQRIGLPKSQQFGFTTGAITISDLYKNEKPRAHAPKHKNQHDQEAAFPFEHFMGVTRLALGVIDGLQNNAIFGEIPFLNRVESRPNYLAEIAYTAFLHDIIEESRMTVHQARDFLESCLLESNLVDQIITNLTVLNNKRKDPKHKRISFDRFVEEILEHPNPVILIVKYADIIHNNKSETPGKWDDDGHLSEKWIQKQNLYQHIVAKMIKEPTYIRQKEIVGIFTANPELVRFDVWRELLQKRPDRAEIFQKLPGYSQKLVATTIST